MIGACAFSGTDGPWGMQELPLSSSPSSGLIVWLRRLFCLEIRLFAFLAIFMLVSSVMFGGERFLLSNEGSGRATAYVESPKIISFDGKTHAAWLDTPPAGGFSVRIRTRDNATGEWSGVTDIGEATDNHGGPALTVDEEGYLHVIYYSHHHPFRYRKSVRPNDSSEWTEYAEFGVDLTYPALVCATDGTLIMTARRSFKEKPWELEMWTKAPGGDWARQRSILRSRHLVYTQFTASLAWGPDHKTLHLGARIYEVPGEDAMVSITTVGYLASDDNGVTWRKANGDAVALPATPETFDSVSAGRTSHGQSLHVGSMAVDAKGKPHLVYGVKTEETAQSYWASLAEHGQWQRHHLNPYLPGKFREWDLFMHGGISFGADGQPLIVGTVMQVQPGMHEWGEVTTELVRFHSHDGGTTFTADILDKPDAESPRWMPNIERPTGFNEVADQPSFIYTDGVRGDALHDVLSNHVYWISN
ncbi:MAG: hypothetical protein HOH58_05095 [Opitutaceae bacterium]|nr:hypothetical protein [Opitutaceae bacterium]